ncbi:hypothetical protein [Cohnella yongneupensis]|uniref:Uncharacterized protein n=1 Tax=Cohnella yongneupensis TaxID=425006 RepID=A0ABW0R1K3_9BACL
MRTTDSPTPSVTETYRHSASNKRSPAATVIFVLLWFVLIGGGVAGAKWYSDRIQNQVSADLQAQTASQISLMQIDYDARMTKLEGDYQAQLAQMQSKIDALNELLTFTKDNADTKTDNSNKLYTQLADVKKQLAELKKNLDVLK